MTANLTLNGLVFDNTGTSAIKTDATANGTLTLGSGGITINATAGAVTLGLGTAGNQVRLILGAAQTWTNNSNNALTLANNQSINTGGFTLTVAGTGNMTTGGGVISGTGGLTKNGAGTLTLGAANTFSGTTLVSAGKLYWTNAGGLRNTILDTASAAGSLYTSQTALNLGGLTGSANLSTLFGGNYSLMTALTLNSTAANNSTYSGVISDGAAGMTVTKQGASTQVLAGANTYTGGTVVNAGNLILSGVGTLGATTGNLSVGTTAAGGTGSLDLGGTSQTVGYVTFNGSGTVSNGSLTGTAYEGLSGTVTAVLAGSGVVLTKNGTGTLTLNATNTYSGGTVLNNGTLTILKDNALGTGALTINGGTIGQTNSALNPTMTNNNTIVINGDFASSVVANGGLDLGSGDVSLGSTVASNRTITVTNSGGTLTIGGNITNGSGGANQIVKAGAGTLNLNGNSTVAPISGGAVIKQGILNLSFGSNTGGGDVVNAVGNGTIVLGDAGGGDARLSTGSFTIANEILLGTGAVGNLIIGSTGATRASLYTGNVTMNGNNLTILNAGSSTNHRFLGNFTGAGNLTIMNNATTTGFVMMNGTLNNGGNILASTSCSTNGGTAINGNIGSSVVNVSTSGPATLTLNGTNSYTGNTTVGSTGTLKIGNASALGNGAMVTINQNANLLATTNMTTTKNFVLVGAGTQAIGATAGNTLTINGTIDTTGVTSGATIGGTGGAGTVALNSSNNLWASGSTLLVNGGASLAMGNALSLNGTTLKYNGGNMLDNTGTGANAFTAPVGLQGFVLTDGVTFNGTNSLDLSGVETGFVQTVGRTRTITVNTNTLTMNGIQATGTAVNSGNVFVDGNMTKSGAGTLVFAGANGYTGVTTISQGTLQIGNGGSLGSLSTNSTISNNGTLAFNRNNTVTQGVDFNSVISGNGSVSQLGTGTLVLNGTNTYNGTTTVNSGTLQVSGTGTLGSTSANLTVNGGVMDLGGTSQTQRTVTFAGGTTQNGTLTASTYAAQNGMVSANLTGTATLTKTTTGTVVLSGNNTYTGTTTVTGGILEIAGTTNIGTAVGQVANTGTGMVYVPTGGNFSANNFNVGNTSGFGSVVIDGGTVATTTAAANAGYAFGAGSYGGLFMSSGSFTTNRFDGGGASVLSTAINVTQISGGNFTNSEYILLRGAHSEFTLTGGTVNHTSATQNIGLEGVTSSTLTVAGGLLDTTGTSVVFGRAATSTNATLNLNGGTLLTNSIAATAANISGSANVNFNGGTLKASGTNTAFLSGNLTNAYVNAGGAVIDTNGFNITFTEGLSAPTGDGLSGLTLGSAGSGYIGAPLVEITGGGGTGATGYAVVDLDPASGTFGQVTGVVLTNPGVGYTSSPTINLLGGGGSGAGVSASGLVANTSGGLTKLGTGTLTLSADSTYSGGTIINAGSVQANAANAMGTGVVTVNGTGTFYYGVDTFIEGLVSNKAGGFSLFNNSQTTTYITVGSSGIVNQSGAGQLTIANSGNRPTSVILGSSQTWTNNGTKIMMNGNGTANTLDLAANTLTLNGTGSGGYQFDAPIIGTGNIVKNSTGNMTVTNTNTYNGTTTINSGTLNVGTGTDAGSIANTSAITNNGSLVYNVGTGTRTLAAVISGTGSVTQNSVGGLLTLTANNTYTGTTTVNGGAISITDDKNLGAAPMTATAAHLVLNDGALVTTGTVIIADNRGILLGGTQGGQINVSSGTTTYGGIIAGSNKGLQKTGTGVLLLSGANSYTGATQISAGTLLVNGSTNASSAVSIESGGTLGGIGTVNGTVAVADGGTLSPGNSPGVLTQGATTLNGNGNYNWQIVDADPLATPGNGYDSINLTAGSALTISSTSGTPFNINLWSLSSISPDVNGNAQNWNSAVSQSWVLFATDQAISGFSADKFAIHTGIFNGTGGFTNSLDGGNFSVALGDSNTDLMLVYTAVPEPTAWILAAFGLTTAVVFRRRRQD